MENRFKLRFCRIFQSSFFSCRPGKFSDIIDKAISIPRRKNTHKKIPNPETFRSRRKVSEKFSPFLAPPASPISPLKKLAPLCEFRDCLSREKKKHFPEKIKRKTNSKKKNKKKNRIEEKNRETNYGGAWWYSSEDEETEDETETLFSSRSFTSDSSVLRTRRRVSDRKNQGFRRNSKKGIPIPLPGKVKGSYAVVKNSADPYKDFRASMVEMIIEKEIFAEKELEELFKCFLSLNSDLYHGIIVQVYNEIREILSLSDLGFGN